MWGASRSNSLTRKATRLSQPRSRIALDATYSVGDQLSGVGIYSREILTGLARLATDTRFSWCYRPHRFLRSLSIPIPGNCGRRLLFDNLPVSCTLFHGLNQRLPSRRYRRSVVTFHDLFVMTGDYSTAEFRARFTLQAQEAAKRADLIIAVSRFTAGQVQSLLHVEPARMRVVPHGIHMPPFDASAERERIVLFVGALQMRKNIVRLVRAFERLPDGWRLVLAGGWGFGREQIEESIRASPAHARIECPGYVSDQELRQLYRRAAIFAFPSLDEGFGIPVLEAMANGIPVLTSNRSGCGEIGEGAALLVQPDDDEAIAAALLRLANDKDLQHDLRVKGLERAREHSWDRSVRETWAVYATL